MNEGSALPLPHPARTSLLGKWEKLLVNEDTKFKKRGFLSLLISFDHATTSPVLKNRHEKAGESQNSVIPWMFLNYLSKNKSVANAPLLPPFLREDQESWEGRRKTPTDIGTFCISISFSLG